VPCAGGNCANGPNGTDSVVDALIITPDQQFPGRTLLQRGVCDPDHCDQSKLTSALASEYKSSLSM
jgi:hypothetical protein